MSHRCIDAFVFDDRVYPNGIQVDDSDPILKTHAGHFAEVDESGPTRAVEQAVAEPGGLRSAPKKAAAKKAPAKATSAKPTSPEDD